MNTSRPAAVTAASIGALIAAAALIGPAQAQEAGGADTQPVGLKEIVVTAQKRAANLQETPISISVMDASDLVNRHAQSLEDLGDGSIPSLRIAPFFARSSALTLGMRGIGALGDANQPARDQAVGVYVDGVYLGRAQGLGAALYDVERIEVLKGPQGTLFGRNTEGGAVSIITRRPTGEFGANFTAGYGNYDAYKAEGHVDLPSFHNVALKFDGLITKRDGTVRNPGTSGQPDFNAFDKRGFHAEALWTPSKDVEAEYAFDISHDGTTPYYVQLMSKGALALAPIMQLAPERVSTANFAVPMQESVGQTWGHRLTLDWHAAEGLEVKNIASYRDLEQSQFDNAETALSVFTPNAPFSRYSLAHVRQRQYSDEFQVLGRRPGLELVGGAFYYNEYVRDNAQTPNSLQWNASGTGYTTLSLDLNTVPFDRASHVTTESAGVFGQGVWTPPVMDGKAHLTLGGRFTHDSKTGSLDTVNGKVPSYVDANKQTITGAIPLDKSWDHFDPLVNLAVDATDDVNLYGRWGTGYKAGGANSRSLTYRPYDPETVSMFELGAKTQWWDRRVRFNLAAYYGDLKDVQVDFNVIILNNNRGTLETTNAATGSTRGVEADLTVNPAAGLTLSASYAYTKVKLSQAFNPFTGKNAVIYPLYTPENAASFAADYSHPLWGATATAHVDANLSGGQYTSSTDPTKSDGFFIVNGRLALNEIKVSDNRAELQIALWARNLFDEQHAFLRNTNASLGTYGIFNEPRTFGVEANFRY